MYCGEIVSRNSLPAGTPSSLMSSSSCARDAQALVDAEALVEVRIVDEALPADRRARLLEVDAHHDLERRRRSASRSAEPPRVVERGARVVDRARADDHEQPVVARRMMSRMRARVAPISASTGVPAIGKKRIRCSGGGNGGHVSMRSSSVRLVHRRRGTGQRRPWVDCSSSSWRAAPSLSTRQENTRQKKPPGFARRSWIRCAPDLPTRLPLQPPSGARTQNTHKTNTRNHGGNVARRLAVWRRRQETRVMDRRKALAMTRSSARTERRNASLFSRASARPPGWAVAVPHGVSLITTIAAGFGLALVFGFIAARLRCRRWSAIWSPASSIGPATPGFVADVRARRASSPRSA